MATKGTKVEKGTKGTAAALAFSFLAFVSFFSFVPRASGAVKNPDTFIYLTIGDIDTLDPAMAYDTASHSILANTYEYLFGFKAGSLKELEPQLAERVPTTSNGLISKDGLTYTLPIRRGVKFQQGGILTPEDVRYSLLRFLLQDRDGGPASLLLEPILGVNSTRDGGKIRPGIFLKAAGAVQVKGDAVVVTLNAPFAPFLSILASFGAVVDKEWVAANGGWDGNEATWEKFNNPAQREDSYLTKNVNGTGPFMLERQDRTTKEIVLVRFDGYRRGPAKLKRVHVKVVEDFNNRKLRLAAGDADVIYAPRLMLPHLEKVEGVEIIDKLENLEFSGALAFNYALNTTANPLAGSGRLDGDGIPSDFFTDKEIRQAFSSVLDFDAYVRDIQRGVGKQAVGFIPKGLLGYDPEGPKYVFDLKKAEAHFRKAHGGKVWSTGFRLSLIYTPGSQGAQILASMVKKNVESLNPKFRIDVRPMEWSTRLSESHAKKIPIETSAWLADYPDPHNFAFPIAHSQGYFSQKSSYKNPAVDDLIAQAAAETDAGKRDALYKKLQRLVFEDVPFVPIADGFRYRTQRKWVKGWVFHPTFPDSPYSSYYYDLYKAE